jgi:hypothetical protein
VQRQADGDGHEPLWLPALRTHHCSSFSRPGQLFPDGSEARYSGHRDLALLLHDALRGSRPFSADEGAGVSSGQ